MNQEANNNSDAQQPGKSATYKRANRQGRNRPTLVTSSMSEQATAAPEQSDTDEALSAGVITATTTSTTSSPDTTVKKGRPKFFSTIGKKEEVSEAITVDPAAARLSRAARSATKPIEKKSSEVSKPAAKSTTPAKSSPARSSGQPVRKGGFKPRHLIGILIYLLVADLVGAGIHAVLGSNDRLLFTIGPLSVTTSTLLFLLTLVVLLIVLARFDLIPRSLAPASQARTASKGSSQSSSSDETMQPGIKQGVKGSNDDLYQEYRQNQRYWQRKDRKK